MSSRRVAPLSGDAVASLPRPCRRCLFWELGRPRPDRRRAQSDDELAGDPQTQKQAWSAARTIAGDPPGRVIRLGDEIVAYVLFAPQGCFAARRAPAPTASADALLLATMWVEPHLRDRGLGRVLVQATVKEALRLDLDAVEAYGDRRFREQDCVLPATWLLHEGFVVHGEHPRYPLLRLAVKRTARWTETVEAALEEVLARLPGPVPGRALGAVPGDGTSTRRGAAPRGWASRRHSAGHRAGT